MLIDVFFRGTPREKRIDVIRTYIPGGIPRGHENLEEHDYSYQDYL